MRDLAVCLPRLNPTLVGEMRGEASRVGALERAVLRGTDEKVVRWQSVDRERQVTAFMKWALIRPTPQLHQTFCHQPIFLLAALISLSSPQTTSTSEEKCKSVCLSVCSSVFIASISSGSCKVGPVFLPQQPFNVGSFHETLPSNQPVLLWGERCCRGLRELSV